MKNRNNNLNKKTPFFTFDKTKLLGNFKQYEKCFMPQTEICYAMKANSEKPVLETLNKAGASFEVASKYELSFLKKINVKAEKIIYGTSVKPEIDIKDFVKYGVSRFAFDSLQELLKISRQAPGARGYVRVLVDDESNSVFELSKKFGASPKEGIALLLKAKELGLKPYGISFNVGSQARNAHAWARGIADISRMMKILLEKGIKIEVVNLGGGFPVSYQKNDHFPDIEKISSYVKLACEKLPYQVKYIVEPGRGLVADAFTLTTSVIGKSKRPNGNWLYLDAGVYNALLESTTSQGSTKYKILAFLKKKFSKKTERFILSGPTGDSLDVINSNILLPKDIEIGDRLVIHDVGAYSFTLMTPFNGFPKPKIFTK